MPTERSKSTVNNVELSCSNYWNKSINDTTVTVKMLVPSNDRYKLVVEMYRNDEKVATFEEFKNPFDTKQVVTDFTNLTTLQFVVPETFLEIGDNVLKFIVTDEVPEEDTTGTSEVTHVIKVETRNSFEIERKLAYKSEYLISGSGSIDNANGFNVNTKNGSLKTVCIPKKPIEMDGRATVQSIEIDATPDFIGECEKDIATASLLEMGDYTVQKIPFDDVLHFDEIKHIQAIDIH